MKYYRPGMIFLVFIPLLLIPFLYSEFHKRDFRIIKFNLPERECEEGQICFDISSLYIGSKFDTLFIDQLNESTLSLEFGNFRRKLVSDSISGSFKVTKGIIFKLSSTTEYEKIIKLLNNCEKFKLDFYGLDLIKNQFVLIPRISISFSGPACGGVIFMESKQRFDFLTQIKNYFMFFEFPYHQNWINLILVSYVFFVLFSILMFFKNKSISNRPSSNYQLINNKT